MSDLMMNVSALIILATVLGGLLYAAIELS
jgi:hypothetical protein